MPFPKRPFSTMLPEDAPALLAVWNRSAIYDRLNESLFDENVWGDADFEQELALVASDNNAPVAFAQAVVRQLAAGPRGYIKLLAVAPEHQHQGLGTQLVTRLHEELRGEVHQIRVGESAPNYLFPGVDTRYANATKLFESLGYKKVGEATNLKAPLTEIDFTTVAEVQALSAKAVEVRRAAETDITGVEALLTELWPSWQSEVATAMSNTPSAVHIAMKDKRVVGFAAYDGNNRGTGWFGPMGTHPEFRGLGIGKVLLKRCLEDLQKQELLYAIIPWVSETGIYSQQVGATLDRTFARYEYQLV